MSQRYLSAVICASNVSDLHDPLSSLLTRLLQFHNHDSQNVKKFTEDVLVPLALSLDFTGSHNLSGEDMIAVAPEPSVLRVSLQGSFVHAFIVVAEHHGSLDNFGRSIWGGSVASVGCCSVVVIRTQGRRFRCTSMSKSDIVGRTCAMI